MNINFQYKNIRKQKRYAFCGSMMDFESREIRIENLKTRGRSYPGVVGFKMYDEFTDEELEKDLKEDEDFFESHYKKEGLDVFNMFRKHFGIELYNISESECIKYPNKYIKLFSEEELCILKSTPDVYRNYWHHVTGYLHPCPRVATISFKKMLEDLEDSKETYFWKYKITSVLHKTFGDKESFFFIKWQYQGKDRTTKIDLKY